ncbi:MAG: hypothetical protein OXN90_03280 [Gemmatimonadota bacterium]|nr:hypothetical protein [Gemmatimonadota bacterium]
MKARTLLTSAYAMPVVGLLVLAGVFLVARPSLAQEACPLPEGVTPPAALRVTAQQVEDGSATLMDFALAARDQFSLGAATAEEALYLGCLLRQEGSHWRSGSTYLVTLTADGRVFIHAKDMSLSGRQLNPLVYGTILQAVGINPADLTNPATALAAFAAAAAGNVSSFNIPDVPGTSGYAAVYISTTFGLPFVMLAGFDLNESHLAEEAIDYGDPTITARDVVDRETLKTFVTQAGEWFLKLQKSGDLAAATQAKIALRDPNGPWIHGNVYIYVVDRISNIILFHGGFPDRFELRPPGVSRDAVTGELIRDQIFAAAASSPEGGFWQYHFDDPTDDTDSADIPKVGYAREFTGEASLGGRVIPISFIVGSGFYHSSPDDASTVTRTETWGQLKSRF